jgi:hypothetical protein
MAGSRLQDTNVCTREENKPMTTMNLVLFGALAVLAVLYMARRRSRLKNED